MYYMIPIGQTRGPQYITPTIHTGYDSVATAW